MEKLSLKSLGHSGIIGLLVAFCILGYSMAPKCVKHGENGGNERLL